jgi:hypothetical protein
MENHNTTTGAGIPPRILDVKDAVFASHDYNQGPQTCFVHDIGEARLYHCAAQLEQAAHMMASFLGQLVDEGHLDALGEQDTMSGMTPKFAALRLLDRFDGIAYGE